MKCLQTIDLPLNCDAVEYYREAERDLVACGMYELVDGKRMGSVAMLQLDDDNKLNKLESVDTSGVFDLKWSTQGLLGSSCADGSLMLFNSELKPKSQIQIGESFCLALAWINASTVAVSSSDGSVSVCDVETESVLNSFPAHSYPHDSSMPAEVWTVASNGTNMLATGADEGALKLWDIRESPTFETSTLLATKRGAHEDCGVCSLQFTTNSDQLISGGYDSNVRLWDMKQPRSNVAVQSTKGGLGGGIWRIKLRNNRVFTACMRGGFQVLDFNDFSTLHKYTEQEPQWEALAYGADWISDTLLAGCTFYDRKLRVFEI